MTLLQLRICNVERWNDQWVVCRKGCGWKWSWPNL